MKTKVSFGEVNTSTEVNEQLAGLVRDMTGFEIDLRRAGINAQTTWYTSKAFESHVHDKLSDIMTAALSLYRPRTYMLVPRTLGIRTPLIGGLHYEIDASTATAMVLSDFGHVTPGLKLRENKLLYMDGSLPDSLTIEKTYSSESMIERHVTQTEPTRAASGIGWVDVVNLRSSNLSTFTTTLKVTLPDTVSSSKFNNISIVPIYGTYVRNIGTTESGAEIADFSSGLYSGVSNPIDIYFPTIQSSEIYINLGTGISLSGHDRNRAEVVTGLISLNVYYNEYIRDSQFNIRFYDYVDVDSDSLVEATMRPHVPDIYLQKRNGTSYSSSKDTGSLVTATLNGDASITFSILNNLAEVPVVIDRIRVALT